MILIFIWAIYFKRLYTVCSFSWWSLKEYIIRPTNIILNVGIYYILYIILWVCFELHFHKEYWWPYSFPETVIDTFCKEGKPQTVIAKEAGCSKWAVSRNNVILGGKIKVLSKYALRQPCKIINRIAINMLTKKGA